MSRLLCTRCPKPGEYWTLTMAALDNLSLVDFDSKERSRDDWMVVCKACFDTYENEVMNHHAVFNGDEGTTVVFERITDAEQAADKERVLNERRKKTKWEQERSRRAEYQRRIFMHEQAVREYENYRQQIQNEEDDWYSYDSADEGPNDAVIKQRKQKLSALHERAYGRDDTYNPEADAAPLPSEYY